MASAPKPIKIYTKSGDQGESGLVGGKRISKQSGLFEAIGDVDELNAWIGLCRCKCSSLELDTSLQKIQSLLFEIGAELATPQESRFVNETLAESHVQYLEASIDFQTKELAPLRSFILPGGTEMSANLHAARAVCRRAERSVVGIANDGGVRPVVLQFLNRLSDWLFVAARTANRIEGVEDVKWETEASES